MYISNLKVNYSNKANGAIIVDGIIGAGKTSVGKLLSEHFKQPFFEEIKDENQFSLVQKMLDKFYVNPSRWSFATQVMFLTERFKDMVTIQKENLKGVCDRSIYGDEIFARTVLKRGQMIEDEFLIYQGLLKNMLSMIDRPLLLIYLDVSVDTAMERIKKRARSSEADLIPRDYMEDLKKEYDLWYEGYDISPKIKIDFNETYLTDGKWTDNALDDFLDSIDKIYKKTTLTSC